MKHFWIFALVLLASPAFSQARRQATAAKSGTDFAEIDRKWLAAEKNGDVAYCEKFFADSYVLITPDGHMYTKKEWLDVLRGPNRPRLETLMPDHVQAHVYPNLVVLTDHTTIKGADKATQSLDGEYEVFRLLLKEDGEWKAGGVAMNKLK